MNRSTLIVAPPYRVPARRGCDPLFDQQWTPISALLLALYRVWLRLHMAGGPGSAV